jgi:ubiquinone/menaquinone biosynthesis C-methylase UbiE
MSNHSGKEEVRAYWEASSCGEVYSSGADLRAQLDAQARMRYALEPYISGFAKFDNGRGRDVLEIGVGMGADHLEWARAQPRMLVGVDLTRRAVAFTDVRLRSHGITPHLAATDAEDLPFQDASFDIVYSWGVLHHSPDTPRAVSEVWRVLRPGGVALVMIYHARSIVTWMLWLRYALFAGRPFRSMSDVCANHLESPGTKVYSIREARQMFSRFASVRASSTLSFADLLEGEAGRRHGDGLIGIARALWPRWLIARAMGNCGLDLLIEAVK